MDEAVRTSEVARDGERVQADAGVDVEIVASRRERKPGLGRRHARIDILGSRRVRSSSSASASSEHCRDSESKGGNQPKPEESWRNGTANPSPRDLKGKPYCDWARTVSALPSPLNLGAGEPSAQ